jgi:uncharacterized protein YkwD
MKDLNNPGRSIISLNLKSGSGKTDITRVNLLLDKTLDESCEKIYLGQEESSLGIAGFQESTSRPAVYSESSAAEESRNLNPDNMETQLLFYINNIRTRNGLCALGSNQTLVNIADSRCRDMLSRNYFNHVTPEGKNIFNILQENRVMYASAGENLYGCSPPSAGPVEVIISTWLGSGGHRENLFNPHYTRVGIKIVDGENRRVVTAIFLN